MGLQGCIPLPRHLQRAHSSVGTATGRPLQELGTIRCRCEQLLGVLEAAWLRRESGKPGLTHAGENQTVFCWPGPAMGSGEWMPGQREV